MKLSRRHFATVAGAAAFATALGDLAMPAETAVTPAAAAPLAPIDSTNAAKNSAPVDSWFTAMAGLPVRTTSVSFIQLGKSCELIWPRMAP